MNWGQNGFVWIPEDIFKSRVRAVYRIHVDMASPSAQLPVPLPVQVPTSPSATPAPSGAPPAPGCPPGTTSMFGLCVPIWGGGQ
jgi:hypothetical protein